MESRHPLQDLHTLDSHTAFCRHIHCMQGLGCHAALGVMPEDLLRDLESLGLFFEDMAVRDLRIYAETLGGEVLHYRDNTGLECDAVIHLDDGRWGAVEIKLGGDELIEAGADSLKKAPSFLMVLTAVGSSYRREDGVYVVPINLLKP